MNNKSDSRSKKKNEPLKVDIETNTTREVKICNRVGRQKPIEKQGNRASW